MGKGHKGAAVRRGLSKHPTYITSSHPPCKVGNLMFATKETRLQNLTCPGSQRE